MRAVQILGLGLIVGLTATGALLATITFRWSEVAFPPGKAAPAARQPAAGAAAPLSPEVSQGQNLFRQNCSSCHTIGGGRLVGPDLKGVTDQRPRDWLVRFITEPDKVIASGDPTAQALLKEYGSPMPNLGITPPQAEQILAYIIFQSSGASPGPGGPTPGGGSQATPSGSPQAAPPAGGAPPAKVAGNAQQGQAIFEQRCTGCHTIGGGKKVGPDLKGVTQRESHDWLVSFITGPDKVIASGDQRANSLLREYGVPMPNLGITQQQAEDILAYLQSQS